MTAILSLPLLTATMETATNEDWRDNFTFVQAGNPVSYASVGNTGNGSLGTISVFPIAPIGDTVLNIRLVDGAITLFGLTDSDGNLIGVGEVGVPFDVAGFQFTLTQGSAAFDVGDTFTIRVSAVPIDLTGITFLLGVRPQANQAYTPLTADTTLGVGDGITSGLVNFGTAGVLSIAIPQAAIFRRLPIGDYAFDVLAVGDNVKRRVVTGTLSVVSGMAFSS